MDPETNLDKKHVFVFDNARSCSNLLGKLFSAHPDLQYERHPYQLAMTRGPERLQLGISDETMKELMRQASALPPELAERWGSVTFAQSHQALRASMDEAEKEVCIVFQSGDGRMLNSCVG